MNYTERKQAELQELHVIFDSMSEIMDLDREISEKAKMVQSLPEMTEEDIKKIKQEHPFNEPKYYGPREKALDKFREPRWNVVFALELIYLIVYILLGLAAMVWSGFQIFAYNNVVPWKSIIFVGLGDNFSIVTAIVAYEIFLIPVWILGGVITKWFHW